MTKSWKFINALLLSGVCAGSLLAPYEAKAESPFSRSDMPRAWWSPKDEFATESVYLSPEKLKQKIKFLRMNIQDAPSNHLSESQKKSVLEAFDLIVQTERGRKLIEKAHPMMTFQSANMSWESNGFYNGSRAGLATRMFDAIDKAPNERIRKAKILYLAGFMAEQFTRSSHFVNRMHWKGTSIRENFINSKIARLHTLLESVTVQQQIMQTEEFKEVSPEPIVSFFDQIAKACQKDMEPQDALKTARSVFTKALWSNIGGQKIEINGVSILPPEKDLQEWHHNNNRLAFVNVQDNIKYFTNDKKPQLQNVGISPLINRYIYMMNIAGKISPDYFLNPKTTAFTVYPDVITGYMNGIKDHEIHTMKVGYMFKAFNKDGTIFRIIMNMDANRGNADPKTTTEYYYGTKNVRAVYKHTRYWVDHYQEFDKNGKLLSEFRFRHNKPEGPATLTENGETVERYFRNGKYQKSPPARIKRYLQPWWQQKQHIRTN